MFCPRCHTAELVERDRDGITIDLCGGCRGVWLDRGELEKLIAADRRRNAEEPEAAAPARPRRRDDDDDDDDDDRRPRRRGWWEIFD